MGLVSRNWGGGWKKNQSKIKAIFKAHDQKFQKTNKICHCSTLNHNEKLCKWSSKCLTSHKLPCCPISLRTLLIQLWWSPFTLLHFPWQNVEREGCTRGNNINPNIWVGFVVKTCDNLSWIIIFHYIIAGIVAITQNVFQWIFHGKKFTNTKPGKGKCKRFILLLFCNFV